MIRNRALLIIEISLGPSGVHIDMFMVNQKELMNGLVILEGIIVLLGLRNKEHRMNNNSLNSFFRMGELGLVLPFRKDSFRVVLNSIDRIILGFQTSNEFLTVIIDSDGSDGEKVVNVLVVIKKRGVESVSMVIELGFLVLNELSKMIGHISEHSAVSASSGNFDLVELSRVLEVINDMGLLVESHSNDFVTLANTV